MLANPWRRLLPENTVAGGIRHTDKQDEDAVHGRLQRRLIERAANRDGLPRAYCLGGSTGNRLGVLLVLGWLTPSRDAQTRSTRWSSRSLLGSGWVNKNEPRLWLASGRQPTTATWPGCKVSVVASSR